MVALVAKQMEFPTDVSAVSDTLHLEFPSHTNHAAILKTLAQFGDVMSFELIPGPPGLQLKTKVVSAVYFDVRAVQRAVDMLGCHRCTVMPQSVSRIVLMGGDVQFDAHGIHGVSNMSTDPSDEGSFLVEFFDSRNVLHAHAAVYHASLSEAETESNMRSTQEHEPYSTQVVVSIKGLPNGICSKPMMQAVLEQAGLEDYIVSSETQTGNLCGHFLLTLNGQQAVDKCVEHFHGRKWDASGAVVVTVESQQTQPQVDWTAHVSPWGSKEGTDCGGSDDEREHSLAPPGLDRSSIHTGLPRWVKPHKACSSRVTASTCSSEPHSDVEFEALSA